MAQRKPPKRPISYKNMSADQILEVYPETFMDCRLAHDWGRRAIWQVRSETVRERTVQCHRCGTSKSMLLNNRGQVVRKAQTHYVQGYQTPKSGLVRSDFTAITYTRDFDKALAEGRVRGTSGEEGTVTSLRPALSG